MTDPAMPQQTTGLRDWIFGLFRLVAMIEGVTTLALFLLAMPLKYIWDDPSLVRPAGLAHGYAFISYVVLMVAALWHKGWTGGDRLRAFVVSLVPFGTLLNDAHLKRRHTEIRRANV